MSPFSIIHSLVKYSLYIGLAGGLVDMTIAMGKRAGEAKKSWACEFGGVESEFAFEALIKNKLG